MNNLQTLTMNNLQTLTMNNLQTANILIVEDEKIVAWDIQETLENLGYKVMATTSSGEEAIQNVSKNKPDLVLMDIQIEGELDGIKTADFLYNSFNIPIIYLTAHSDDQTLERATQTNPFGFLLKPLQPRELHSTIQIALHRHQKESLIDHLEEWFAKTVTVQEWLVNAVNSLEEAVITIDNHGSVTFINTSAQQFTGWNDEEAMGMPINEVLQLLSLKTYETLKNPGIKAMELKQRVKLQEGCLLRSRQGSDIWVQHSATPILSNAGKIIGSVIIVQTAKDRLLTHRALWQRNEELERFQLGLISQLATKTTYFEQAIACMHILTQLLNQPSPSQTNHQRLNSTLEQLGKALNADYIWIALHNQEHSTAIVTHEYKNTQGGEGISQKSAIDSQISLTNFPEFYQILFSGKSLISPPLNILPPPYQAILNPDSRILICPIFKKQIISGEESAIVGEIGILTTENSPWLDFQIEIITQIVHCAVNISQQKELKAAIQAQKIDLEILNYLKDDFISSVSHELKTPLTNMKMGIEMIQKLINSLQNIANSPNLETQNLKYHKLEQYVDILEKEWQREYNLVNDLLNFQAPVNSILPAKITGTINLKTWIKGIINRFDNQAKRFEQTISYQIEPPDLILCYDSLSLERIVIELLNNACKYTPPKQLISISFQEKGAGFELIVTNTGIEIPPEEIEPIFQPFYRIPRSNPWNYCGTGLGLALVKKLVTRLGGNIQAESSQNVTKFIVSLPLLPS